MSLFQMRSKDNPGNPREKLSCEDDVNDDLPTSYTFVPALEVDIKKAQISCALSVSIPENLCIFEKAEKEEQDWLTHFIQTEEQGTSKEFILGRISCVTTEK